MMNSVKAVALEIIELGEQDFWSDNAPDYFTSCYLLFHTLAEWENSQKILNAAIAELS